MSASLEDVKDFDFIISEALRIQTELDSDNFREFYEKEYNENFGCLGMTINAPNELYKKIMITQRDKFIFHIYQMKNSM